MTREEFCKFLITVKKGSKLKFSECDMILQFDDVESFISHPSQSSYRFSIGYIFSNLSEFEIIRIPRKVVFEFYYNVDHYGVFDKNDPIGIMESFYPSGIKISERNNIRITIEEIL